MVKVKTSELSGAALDWAVAKCEGLLVWVDTPVRLPNGSEYNPSSDWAQGGPIIEREGITVAPDDVAPWCAFIDHGTAEDILYSGTTPLIAAMRCYVASKLGDEIEFPEGLK